MNAEAAGLLAAQTVFRFGRTRTQHDWRVVIVEQRVEVHTRCGRAITGDPDAAHTQGFVTCEDCQ